MHILDALSLVNTGLDDRHRSGDPVSVLLRGLHPDFLVEELGPDTLTYHDYRVGSPNLIGYHPLRQVVAIGDTSDGLAPNIAALVDGIGYHNSKIFGLYVSAELINSVAQQVGADVTISSRF